MKPGFEIVGVAAGLQERIGTIKVIGHHLVDGFLDRVATVTGLSKFSTGRDQVSPFTDRERKCLTRDGVLPQATTQDSDAVIEL